MTASWRLNLLLRGGVRVQGEATRAANSLSVELRQPFASLSESLEISGSDSTVDDAAALQILERLYRLAEQLQNRRPELELELGHVRARLAKTPGLVSEAQFRETRRDLRKQLRDGLLEKLDYQRRITRLRKAWLKSLWAFDASPRAREAAADGWARSLTGKLSRYTCVPASDVATAFEAVWVIWDEFFLTRFPFELSDLTRWQVIAILDGRRPLVNQLPAIGCCSCGKPIGSLGGRRLIPRALEIEAPRLDETGRRRWICQRCVHSECRGCGRVLSIPMGRDILYEDGAIRHVMIVGVPCCSNPACRR